ncbi:hypothetical protein [Streptomyces sp. NBC_00454]|uniref:hypothetical protein n=1 Tax=Streptomyces sp. NBC_00454 TaxID=2975747 RepID=UPI0030DECBAF
MIASPIPPPSRRLAARLTRVLLPACGAAALVGTAVAPASAAAAPTPVACSAASLSAAITAANASGGSLSLATGCTYALTAPLPAIKGAVTIEGHVATITRAPKAPPFGILVVDRGGNLTISHVIITGGNAAGSFGGGIRNDGTLSVAASIISNNKADYSGGIAGTGGSTTTITNSFITGNTATRNGGGFANDGHMTITRSTVSDNTALEKGGGVANDGVLKIDRSALTNNSASGPAGLGGGIANFGGPGASTTLDGAIVTGNRATAGTGGVYNNAGKIASSASTTSLNQPNNCMKSVPAVPLCSN